MKARLAPGSTIGIVGGGQLGRMLAMAAARMGFRIVILEPQPECPAAQVANHHLAAAYDDHEALSELARLCDVVTYEFENVPLAAAEALARKVRLFPPPRALQVAQDRLSEKEFLQGLGISTAPFASVDNEDEARQAHARLGGRCMLKTRRLGYDGKGQARLDPGDDAGEAFAALGDVPMVMEAFVDFEREISIVAARGANGMLSTYDPAWNHHREGILRSSTVPAEIGRSTALAARAAVNSILTALSYVGVIGVEFFVLTDGDVIVNEIAPRVHNSGHWTEAACIVSQFEQHIRAIAHLPLGDTARHCDCVMENLIGDDVERVAALLAEPGLVLHLYGKAESRPGRKMGHFTRLAPRQGSSSGAYEG